MPRLTNCSHHRPCYCAVLIANSTTQLARHRTHITTSRGNWRGRLRSALKSSSSRAPTRTLHAAPRRRTQFPATSVLDQPSPTTSRPTPLYSAAHISTATSLINCHLRYDQLQTGKAIDISTMAAPADRHHPPCSGVRPMVG